ncbi:non-hydrolyzing UDP-N-acetylglucosamine 2-epimerase [Methanosarcina mazei]|uniref:UDP-N-acetylglucosamine 2-epimerase n=2 Tax=Methanosarcina mazei TaxID=2209 RepID=A0A0F8BJK4_METMZ|nr:UDP-N-acetylglucosamine 2-epimerase (non-hydrolyzing) [Methanosarcina mazei]AKB71734.1 UDP-N-acetylglucosamine 2-epimerase [Methanosarcina mazei C16]KKG02301.1 UDP-N-acetylglucosamine 2-epimerase [Methanosarcina mazei]KKG61864.1 UDP-N-acetylglucosamine 2-epimerase [Methanosarcina mazei]NLO30922.1 UDP-N-acetylglucosamine 2-epimerase (non-hydrolyzing) [Methanosarcina mazei]
MNILSVIGARPQFIKCAPLSRSIRKEHTEILVHTGQHYDPEMSDIFFKELNIPEPDYNLGVGSSTHGEQTGKMLIEIEKVLAKEKPDLVLVYGDTNSTLAGALAASKLSIKVAHVEAGLRSFDRSMPEEINRVLTDHTSGLLLCPTKSAVLNLEKEGINTGVYNVGDVMLDALKYNLKIAEEKVSVLEDLSLNSNEYMVATVHRASNTDNSENLSSIVNAFCDAGVPIVFPVHPRTKKYLKHHGLWEKLCEKVKVVPPLGYLEMLKLMAHSRKVLTDSGGVQKEAYMLGVPCITMRENTEWVETVEDGGNILVGAVYEKIMDAIFNFEGEPETGNFFGTGNACVNICEILKSMSVSYSS